ncbi:hypothetical protein SS50377_23804 [Spironucleus salmonicida]|uniref:Uncharacterized protein n=1 Tax=Spironucleus salmonicida TaxID=348837 RepID=V6LP76_9EUKA|nr:hypothetical protein SS50377_23804 [Spironucleus salmonicida]|eukprot:EST46482.1 Hypothetical protein SS50377_13564 [Spironucleus salmonicida]
MEDSDFSFSPQHQRKNYDNISHYSQVLQDKGFESSSSGDTSFKSIMKGSAVEVQATYRKAPSSNLFGYSDIGDDSEVDDTVVVQPMVKTMIKVDDIFSTDDEGTVQLDIQADPTININVGQLKKTTQSADSEPTVVIKDINKHRRRNNRKQDTSSTESESEESVKQQKKHRKRRSREQLISESSIEPEQIYDEYPIYDDVPQQQAFQEYVQLNTIAKNRKDVQEVKAGKITQQSVKTKKGLQKEIDMQPQTIEIKRARKQPTQKEIQNAVRVDPAKIVSIEDQTAQHLQKIMSQQEYMKTSLSPVHEVITAQAKLSKAKPQPIKQSNTLSNQSPPQKTITPPQKLSHTSPKLSNYSQNLVQSLNISELDAFNNSISLKISKPTRRPMKNLSQGPEEITSKKSTFSSISVPSPQLSKSNFSLTDTVISQSLQQEYDALYDSAVPPQKDLLSTIAVEQTLKSQARDPLEIYFERLSFALPRPLATFSSKKSELVTVPFPPTLIPVKFGKKQLPPLRKIMGEKLNLAENSVTLCFEQPQIQRIRSKFTQLFGRESDNQNIITINKLNFASAPLNIAGVCQLQNSDVKFAVLKVHEKSKTVTAQCDLAILVGMGALKVKIGGEDFLVRNFENFVIQKSSKFVIQGLGKENFFWIVE